MFADTAEVSIISGNGGAGAVSFRHEKYVDKGGPDGGDGGRGGDVVFLADNNVNTLADFRFKPELKAQDGGAGGKRKMHGADGEDKVVKVPVGTLIYRDDKVLADLIEVGQRAIVAKGGDGGFGNAHFKSSVRQLPRVAELGEKGEKFIAKLELKLVADVGLVGFPNAGKSTFLSVVTSAKPEIANYAFTTIKPNLGVADIDGSTILIADIPGIIEGASLGKGLGDTFLRHIERTSVILHMIDSLSDDIVGDYTKIRRELKNYSTALANKKEVVVLTKIDNIDDEIVAMQVDNLKKVTNSPIVAISSSSGKNLKKLMRELIKIVANQKRTAKISAQSEVDNSELALISLSSKEQDDAWWVKKLGDRFIVTGGKIERFAKRTDFNNPHGINRLRDIMTKLGITREIEKQGGTGGSLIVIADNEFTLLEWGDN